MSRLRSVIRDGSSPDADVGNWSSSDKSRDERARSRRPGRQARAAAPDRTDAPSRRRAHAHAVGLTTDYQSSILPTDSAEHPGADPTWGRVVASCEGAGVINRTLLRLDPLYRARAAVASWRGVRSVGNTLSVSWCPCPCDRRSDCLRDRLGHGFSKRRWNGLAHLVNLVRQGSFQNKSRSKS